MKPTKPTGPTWINVEDLPKEMQCYYTPRYIGKLGLERKITTRNAGKPQVTRESMQAYLDSKVRLSKADTLAKAKLEAA